MLLHGDIADHLNEGRFETGAFENGHQTQAQAGLLGDAAQSAIVLGAMRRLRCCLWRARLKIGQTPRRRRSSLNLPPPQPTKRDVQMNAISAIIHVAFIGGIAISGVWPVIFAVRSAASRASRSHGG